MRQNPLGINVMAGHGGTTVPEQIALLKAVGWDAFFTPWDPKHTELWANAGAKNGMIYTSIHAPFSMEHRIWIGGEEARTEVRRLIACAEDCARYEIPVMVLHTINGFSERTPKMPTQVGLDYFGEIIEAGNRLGIRLAFENTEREEFLQTVLDTYKDEPSIGFCFDSGHEFCYRNSDLLTRYGDLLVHTHLDDNFGVTGDEITWYDDSHLPLGDGSVDFTHVMERIDRIGYTGVLSCELTTKNKPQRNTHGAYVEMPLEEFYKLALDRVRRIVRGAS